jgi:hypothetical protein
MTTITITAPVIGRRSIPLTDLNTTQRRTVVDDILTRLGTAYGLAEDTPAIPYADRAERLALSQLAAWQIGLTLTTGAEIAQCYTCEAIVDGARTTEDTGVIRCDDCHGDHTRGAQHLADTTYDLWADFYAN